MKKVTLFGLIALIVLAIALPASAELKLGGTYKHTLEFQDQDVTTNDDSAKKQIIVNKMVLSLTSVLTDAPTEKDAKIYIELPLQMTISDGIPSITKRSNTTWKIGYESPIFSILATDSTNSFGRFGDPMGIATNVFNSYIDGYLYGVVHDTEDVTGAGPTANEKADAALEIASSHVQKITNSSTSNGVVVNSWGKIGRLGYSLSIGDVSITPTVDGKTLTPNSVTTTALRLTYDINSSLTVGVIGMIANQYAFPYVLDIKWVDGPSSDYEYELDGVLNFTNIRKRIYTLAADVNYVLSGNTKGSVFGQVAINATNYGYYPANAQFDTIKDMNFNGVGVAAGVKELALGNVKVGATVSMTTPNVEASNAASPSYHTASNSSGRWPVMYLPTPVADNSRVTNSGYYLTYNTNSIFAPDSALVILNANGSWTLNNKAVLEVNAKNGLTMSLKPMVDPDDSTKKTNFVNNLLQLSSNYYLYGENADGKELANKDKDVIKAGLYFDPRFVDLSNNHVNRTFNFITRAYAGVDLKSLGLQADLDVRYGNHVIKGLEIATWAKYSNSFDVSSNLAIAADVALGYRYRTGFEKHNSVNYNVYHDIYGYVSGKTTLGNGIELQVSDAVKFITNSRLVNEYGVPASVKPQNEILNVLRAVVSKELSKIYTISVGYTNKIWYLADRTLYFDGEAPKVSGNRVVTSKGDYVSLNNVQMRNYLDAKLTAKVSSSATITIGYGMTSLASANDFSSGKVWNSALGLATSGGSQNLYAHTIESGSETETFYELYRMVWDKFSLEFSFTF